MSDMDRKRNLSDSSGDETELRKLARVDSDRDSLTEVTDRTDSDSSSDSDSDSDSDSSSSSSSSGEESQTQETGGKTQVKNPPSTSQSSSDPPQTQTKESDKLNSQTFSEQTQNSQQSNSEESGVVASNTVAVDTSEDLDATADLTLDLDVDLDISPEKEMETLSGSQPLSLENADLPSGEFSLGSLDEIQQFLTDSVTASAGPVDPVFVDHEDSQNATNMDCLVFDPTLHTIPGIEGMKSHSIPGMDDMNEPRLDSVCNSTIHSAEGSLILGNEFEDGELPSSPEVPEKILSEKEDEKTLDFVHEKEDTEIAKFASHNRPVEQIESDDDSESEEKIIKKKKKTKKRKKEAKDSETERDELENANVPRRHSKHKKSKQTLPCHKPVTNHSKPSSNSLDDKITYHKSSNKTDSNAKLSELSTKSTKSVDDEKRTNLKSCPYKPSIEDDPKSSINQKGTEPPPLPESSQKESLPVSAVKNPPPPPPEQSIKLEQNVEVNRRNSPSTSEDTADEKTSHPESPNGNVKKCKKLSLKDYKAKKEAEKQRKSLEGSGSESNSTPASEAPSKEPSPAPEPAKFKEILQPEAEKSKVDIPNSSENIPEPAKDSQMEVENTVNTTEPLDMEPISDNDMDTGHVEEENDVLRGFDVLDEIDDIETDNEISKDSGEDSDSLAEDEVDQMLEEDVPKPSGDDKEDIEPQEKLKKLVLEERGQNGFEVLPLGWVSVTHNSGIPLYLHRDTRVVSTSRPYDLGNGSVRKHNIPISAIPCYSYRYYSKLGETTNPAPHNPSSTSTEQPGNPNPSSDSPVQSATTPAVPSCPYSNNTVFTRENVSPDSTTDGALTVNTSPTTTTITTTPPAPDQPVSVPVVDTNIFPRAQIETIEETLRKTELCPEEVTKYCEKIFVFKELEVAKFKTWKERRAYYKQSQKKKLEKELTNRPTLPEGTKIITIPSLELSTIPGTEGDSAINQKVVKKTKKKWIINPVGKSMVCLLHEYVQQSLKMQPYYTFTELDNAATPYAATVRINKIEYGRGTGSSKKIAKSEAARRTLEMLIPEIKDKLPCMTGAEAEGDGPDLSFFDDIRVEDPRVADLCNRTSEPAPYQILVTCLQRNYGLGDTHINQELKAVRNGKNEYTMKVSKREVSVICKNKKDGKQLAAQKLLQQLHPHITSWGSLLRMYGNRSIRKLKLKKDKETEVTGLQTRSSQSSVAPSLAILDKLREEMRNLREIKNSIAPIGKFVAPVGVGQTGLNTDHVDL
eukprot:GFUD01008858.1.p1 GENE.GFUD01008858.1~~GFUD01008858.1.p1  ORF type:complete len:1253 (+),score=362.81 GFUD01008858.1:122-3880(+)